MDDVKAQPADKAMRILLYTALAFFLTLTGVLAFFAMQSPTGNGGPKVVLSIDTGGSTNAADGLSGSNAAAMNESATAGPTDVAPAAGSNNTETVIASTSAERPEPIEPQPESQVAGNPPGTSNAEQPQTEPQQPVAERNADAPVNAIEAVPFAPRQAVATPTTAEERPSQAIASLNRGVAQSTADNTATEPHSGRAEIGATNVATVEDTTAPAPSTAAPQMAAPAATPAVAQVPPLPMRRPSTPPPVRIATAEGWGTSTTNAANVGNPGGIRVAILLRGIGQDRRDSTEAITKLPGAVSFGVVASDDGEDLANKAREKGHEIVVQLPADLDTSSSTGFDFLSSGSNDNAARVKAVISRLKGSTGVTVVAGNKVLQSKEVLHLVLTDIKQRNIVFIGEGTNSHALARELAAELKIRYGNAAVILDTQPTPDGIKAALNRLVQAAQKKGSAIGVGYVSPETIEQIQAWSQGLAAQGITLVPAVSLAGAL